jgi:hypothetical protein
MDCVLHLPVVLACELLCAWLHIPELMRVDSAYCARNQRKHFLELCQHPEFIVQSMSRCKYRHLDWLTVRRIKCRKFDISADIHLELYVPSPVQNLTVHTKMEIINSKTGKFLSVTNVLITCEAANVRDILMSLSSLRKLFLTRFDGESAVFDGLSMDRVYSLQLFGCVDNGHSTSVIMKSFPNLTYLSVDSYSNSSAASLRMAAQNCAQLRALRWHCCDDALLAQLSVLCPHIVHLDLSGGSLCIDAGILSVVSKLKLRSLGLPFQIQLTNTCIQYILQHCADTIEEIHIYHMVGCRPEAAQHLITAAGVRELFTRCVHFKKFTWFVRALRYGNYTFTFASCDFVHYYECSWNNLRRCASPNSTTM